MSLTSFNSSVADDINDIITAPGKQFPYFLFSTKIHTPEKTLDENDGVCIAAHDTDRNYVKNEFNNDTIDFFIRPGTWLYDIYPYAEDLEVTVTMIRQHRLFGATQGVFVEERCKIVYLPDANQAAPTEIKADRSVYDQETPIYVRFQMVSRVTMAARLKTTQGVYSQKIDETNKDMKGDSLLKSILSHELKKIEIAGEIVVKGLDIEPSKNFDPMLKIVIPTGTNIMRLPFLMQEEKGGMYTAGMGSYLQRYTPSKHLQAEYTMFVYSLYDGSKYHDSNQRIIFFVPPDGSHNTVTKTYSYDAGVLKIFSNPIPGLYDVKNNALRSQGEGFRDASARAFMNKPIKHTLEGPVFTQRGLVTEMVTTEQKDGLVNATYNGIDDNHYVNSSSVLARKGSIVPIIVDNLDPDYIYPGAAATMYNEPCEGVLLKLEGVIHRVVTKFRYQNSEGLGEFTMGEHALVSTTFIDLFITNVEETQSF